MIDTKTYEVGAPDKLWAVLVLSGVVVFGSSLRTHGRMGSHVYRAVLQRHNIPRKTIFQKQKAKRSFFIKIYPTFRGRIRPLTKVLR